MWKKGIFLMILGCTLLLTVATVGWISILSKNSAAQTSELGSTKESHLDLQHHQGQNVNYPDPAKQDALPDSVKVMGGGETVLLRTYVTEGYQIYECQASKTDPSGFAWTLQAPFAMLNADNATNVIHSTGPTWHYDLDGSEVRGKVGQFTDPNGNVVPATATPDANAIPWLRLDVTTHLGNTGLFSKVNQIQRLYTVRGKAPSSGCNQSTANNHGITSVDYQAEYVFWGRS